MDKQLYKKAERLLEKEIREQVESDNLTTDSLEIMYKVLDNIKDIYIICAMKREEDESEYSERMYYDDESYARGRGRNARRDSMGRYASRYNYDGSYDSQYDDGRSYDYSGRRGYSRDDELDKMMAEAKTEKERELIRQLKEAKM